MTESGSHLVALVHEAILNKDFVKVGDARDQLLGILKDLYSNHFPVTDSDGSLDYFKLIQSGSLKKHLGVECLLSHSKKQQKFIPLK